MAQIENDEKEYSIDMMDWKNPTADIGLWNYLIGELKYRLGMDVAAKRVLLTKYENLNENPIVQLLKVFLKYPDLLEEHTSNYEGNIIYGNIYGKESIRASLVVYGTEELILSYLSTEIFTKEDVNEMIELAVEFEDRWKKVPLFMAFLGKTL